MSKLKVRSSRTVFDVTNQYGEETGHSVVVKQTRRRVRVKADPFQKSAISEPISEYHEHTDNFQTVQVIGLPFEERVFGEDLSPADAANEGLHKIKRTLEDHLAILRDLT